MGESRLLPCAFRGVAGVADALRLYANVRATGVAGGAVFRATRGREGVRGVACLVCSGGPWAGPDGGIAVLAAKVAAVHVPRHRAGTIA